MKKNVLNKISNMVTASVRTVDTIAKNREDKIARKNAIFLSAYDERQNSKFGMEMEVIDGSRSLIKHDGKYFVVDYSEYRYNYVAAKTRGDDIEHLSIPEEFSTISNGAFTDCLEIKTLNIPGNVNEVGKNAFAGCKNLETVIIGPRGDTKYKWLTIRDDAFAGTGIKTLYIMADEGATITIRNGAFRNCRKLRDICLEADEKPESYTDKGEITIYTRAFAGCENLRYVSARNVSVQRGAFAGTPVLEPCMFHVDGAYFAKYDNAHETPFIYSKVEKDDAETARFVGAKINDDKPLTDEMIVSMLRLEREKGGDLPPITDELLQPTAGWDTLD